MYNILSNTGTNTNNNLLDPNKSNDLIESKKKMIKNKILILTSYIGNSGGIASVFRTLNLKQINGIEDFYTYYEKKKIKNILQYFIFLFSIYKYKIFHLNTPLSKNAFFRDVIYVILIKIFRKRIIIHYHGGEPEFYNHLLNCRLLKHFFSITYGSANASIFLGEVFKDQYKILGVSSPYQYVIPNPIERSYLNKQPKIINFNNDKYLNILYLSRIDYKKGCDIAIDTFIILQQKLGMKYKIVLNICGDGPLLNNMKEYASKRKMQNVIFHGYVTGRAKELQLKNNDIFFFPTYYGEGLPVSMLEAMAFGLPIISRPVGGIPDWVENKVNGFIIDSKEPTVFANAIEKIIRDPCLFEFISKNNIAKSNKYFSPEAITNSLIKIYKSVNNE